MFCSSPTLHRQAAAPSAAQNFLLPAAAVVGDRSSLEIFLNDGAAVFSTRYYPAAGDVAVKISGTDALVYSL